jgi:hypothetical protein
MDGLRFQVGPVRRGRRVYAVRFLILNVMHPFPLFKLRREFRRRSSVGTGEAMISISVADGPGAYGAGFALGVSL